MKPQRITSQRQLDVLVLKRQEGKEREREKERERYGWGLFKLTELKSLSFFTIETDSHNM